jgi:ABC-type transporter Mla maintaining outer membrane lipid asymmetry ATPase subunit MlaF
MRVGERDSHAKRAVELEAELETLEASTLSIEKAVYLLQTYAEEQQKTLTTRIEGIVTKGLRAVFQNPTLEFKLRYSEAKGGGMTKRPEVTMAILHEQPDGQIVEGNLKSSFGGGLSVVAALLLKVVVVLHLNPRVRPILILDEPLKDLSPAYDGQDSVANGYRERMADFLRELTAETDLQIIMVTHEPEYGRVSDVHHRFSGDISTMSKVTTIKHESGDM